MSTADAAVRRIDSRNAGSLSYPSDLNLIGATAVSEHEVGQQVWSAVQVLLAEKRTSLAMLRSGIAVIALPLAITSALIATSNFYQVDRVSVLLVAVMSVNALLLVLGVVLVARSYRSIVHYDRLLHQLKRDHPSISRYLD